MSEIRVNNFKGEDGISAPSFPNGINVTGVSTVTSFSGTTGTFGDFVDVGSNIKLGNAGVVTATTFVGALTGNPTGTLQTAAQPNITSVGTLSSLNVSGNVSIAGTLTYEDVTNVDSVGVVTAAAGDFDDFISVGSNIHFGNAGVATATTFSGSGANLTNLPAANITGTLPSISGANLTGVLKNIVEDSSPQLGGNLDTNGSSIIFEDNNAAFFGTGSDLKVYHDGSNNFIEARGVGDVTTFKTSNSSAADTGAIAIRANGDTSRNDNVKALFGNSDDLSIYHSGSNSFIKASGTGSLYIQADNSSDIYIRPVPSEDGIIVRPNGAVELFENNLIRLKTNVTGDYGSIQLQNGKNGWQGVSFGGATVVMSDGNDIGLYNDTDNEWILKGSRNGEVQLRHNDSIKLQTTSSGVTVTGDIQDTKGPLRRLPMNAQSGNYTLVVADAGKFIRYGGGGTLTIPYNVFSTGDMVTIMNDTGGSVTIGQGSNFSLINSADASTGNRTLAQRGMATVLFNAQNQGYISGSGLS